MFFTFSGIYTAFSQKPMEKTMRGSLNSPGTTKTVKTDTPAIKTIPFVRLFPNPAKNKVELEIKGYEPGFIQLQFFDTHGKKLRNDKRILYSGNELMVVMFSLPPGIYFVLVKQKDRIERRKLLVE